MFRSPRLQAGKRKVFSNFFPKYSECGKRQCTAGEGCTFCSLFVLFDSLAVTTTQLGCGEGLHSIAGGHALHVQRARGSMVASASNVLEL